MSSAECTEADYEEWETFKRNHNKSYSDKEEDTKRMRLYFETREKVKKHNELFQKGEVTFEMGINQFADQLPEEICCAKGVCPKKPE